MSAIVDRDVLRERNRLLSVKATPMLGPTYLLRHLSQEQEMHPALTPGQAIGEAAYRAIIATEGAGYDTKQPAFSLLIEFERDR